MEQSPQCFENELHKIANNEYNIERRIFKAEQRSFLLNKHTRPTVMSDVHVKFFFDFFFENFGRVELAKRRNYHHDIFAL